MTPINFYKTVNFCSKIKEDLKFLELGTSDGTAFNSLFFNNKYTVDIRRPDSVRDHPNSFEKSTDEFFRTEECRNFDIIFIDANHDSEQVLRDYNSSVDRLNDKGIIVLHDCYPPSEEYCQEIFCSDSYKILESLVRKERSAFFTKEDFGLTLVLSPEKIYHDDVNFSLSYDDFKDKIEKYNGFCIEYLDLIFKIVEKIYNGK